MNIGGDSMMNVRKTRAMLWLGSASLFVACGFVVALHIVVPADIEFEPADSSIAMTVESRDDQTTTPIDPASLQRVASKNIRQQLFDPPVELPKPPPPKPLPPIELISTILGDNDQHRAWVRDGQTLRKVIAGDTLGTPDNPVLVEKIMADHLLLQHEDKQIEVTQQAASGGRR